MSDLALRRPSTLPVIIATGPALPALVAAAGDRAATRFLEFFASTLRNPHTRCAYARAVGDFLAWCEDHALPSIAAVQPLHVAAWIEGRTPELSAPTVKQQLAAIRHLFDWLVIGQVVPLNPAASVRGPAHSVRKGKTPVLDPAEARTLLDSIDVTTPIGLRDRALIGLMLFSFGLIGAALAMQVEDVFVQNRRLWVRLREKGGKRHEMLCHHSLDGHRQLVGRRSRWRAMRTARSWLHRSGDAGDLGPNLEGLDPGGSILGGGHLMAVEVEKVVDPVVGQGCSTL